MTVGDRLAGPSPPAAAPGRHGATRGYTRTCVRLSPADRAQVGPQKPLQAPARAAQRAAAAAVVAAAMPVTRVVGPRPLAHSATPTTAPAATDKATRGVRGAQDGLQTGQIGHEFELWRRRRTF